MMGEVPARRVGAVTWDVETTKKQLQDACGVQIGILTGGPVSSVIIPDLDYATALCRAFNEWSRVLAGVRRTISPRRAGQCFRSGSGGEGDRQARRRLQSQCNTAWDGQLKPYGHRFYKPIHEACVRNNLPIAMHLGGMTRGRRRPASQLLHWSRFRRPMNYAKSTSPASSLSVFEDTQGSSCVRLSQESAGAGISLADGLRLE